MCGGHFTTILAGDGLYLGYQKGSPVERQQRGFSGQGTHLTGSHMAGKAHNVHGLARIWCEVNVWKLNLSKFIHTLDAQERFAMIIPDIITSKKFYNSRKVPVRKPSSATLVLNNVSSLPPFPTQISSAESLPFALKVQFSPQILHLFFSPIHRINVYPYIQGINSKGIV